MGVVVLLVVGLTHLLVVGLAHLIRAEHTPRLLHSRLVLAEHGLVLALRGEQGMALGEDLLDSLFSLYQAGLRQLDLHLDYIESSLSATGHFVGSDWSAADILMSFPLEAAAARATTDGGKARPAIASFVERAQARPAYQRALDKGGPYALLS